MNINLQVLFIFLKIGLFSFGGGNAILPLIRQEVVAGTGWLTPSEFTDLVAVSQATPGPIAINGASYVGYKVGGFTGSIIATLGVVLPTFIIMLTFTKFFLMFKDNKYVKYAFTGLIPATVGLIAAAPILVSSGSFIDYKSFIIFAIALFASYKYKADPILMTIAAGVLGILFYK
ncbi:chromate transporter [Clostridium sp. YIM B02515]|uniref:Chromate transporter n=1 Tax=Clostridium rhizosphaerae TaxID=2803861 RepID=A0ABS1T931_9CLOT|nr:chromate transporter [Clostridium rhizosphaerae]MBL4935849.1 chromate transporter [Clostridium rhizosphaerae]